MNYIRDIEETKSDLKIGGYDSNVYFKYMTFEFETNCKNKVKYLQVIPESVEIYFYAIQREQKYIRVPLLEFESRNDNFKKQIIANFNCHGFTLTEGKYWINNDEATKIFEDEFENCNEDQCEIVVFCNENRIIEHSGKYCQKTKTISDKQGVRPIKCSNTVADIKSVKEYNYLTEVYLKRKKLQ